MTPLKQAELELPPLKKWLLMQRRAGVSKIEAKERYRENQTATVWYNETYQIIYREIKDMIWLSIKRHDGQCIFAWPDMQEIKNQLVGTEREMVQLFPAESRKVDMVNQYHMYGYIDPVQRFPFGFIEREVANQPKL